MVADLFLIILKIGGALMQNGQGFLCLCVCDRYFLKEKQLGTSCRREDQTDRNLNSISVCLRSSFSEALDSFKCTLTHFVLLF